MLRLNGENYMIQGETSGFENRQKSIFDQLDAVVKPQIPDEVDDKRGKKFMKTDTGMHCTDDFNEVNRSDTKHLKGKESIFKRPDIPLQRLKRTMPDFQRNPHKWVKYSLGDVSEEDMSDKSNTAAAMAFLNEIKARKEDSQEPMDIGAKITFKKPSQQKSTRVLQVSKEESPGEDGTSYFRGSKLVMPEYVIGEKKVKRHGSKSESGKKKDKEIKLNHLTDYDDDE